MKKLLSLSLNILADVFYPKYCFGCRCSGGYLCKFCSTQIPSTSQSFCIVCNRSSQSGYTHPNCLTKTTPDKLLSAFPYKNQVVADMIITGKYLFVSETFAVLGLLAAKHIRTNNKVDDFKDFIICPLPLHPTRRRWRGFNQAEILANAFEYTFNIPSVDLLARRKNTKTQKELNAAQRQTNMTNAFIATQEIPAKVILIDDVCTTGQTLLEATKVLKQNGARVVVCITVAKD